VVVAFIAYLIGGENLSSFGASPQIKQYAVSSEFFTSEGG
jgi:hypothetical protein